MWLTWLWEPKLLKNNRKLRFRLFSYIKHSTTKANNRLWKFSRIKIIIVQMLLSLVLVRVSLPMKWHSAWNCSIIHNRCSVYESVWRRLRTEATILFATASGTNANLHHSRRKVVWIPNSFRFLFNSCLSQQRNSFGSFGQIIGIMIFWLL